MYCKKCGAGMEEDAVFCPKCGEKVDEAEENRTSTEGYTGAESGGKPDASGKSNKALIMAIALIVFLLLIIAVGGFFIVTKGREGRADRDRDGRAEKDADSATDGSGAVGESAGGDGETYTKTADVTVSVVGANEVGGLSGAEVILRNAEGETIAESETDNAGCASFEDVSSGGYTIACSADGYNARETELTVGAAGNNTETGDSDGDGATNGDDSSDSVGAGTDIQIIVALAPVIVGDDACVLLVWEGDHDLDLCAFHSGLKEYVNIGHPVDSAGNMLLYADHGADQPYELLYIHDISDEVAKSFYVIEAANARVGAASGMEADGVSVYVYDASGLVYFTSADTSENAALWRPCYYYASSVYEEQQYIGDATGESYAWISFNEEDAFAAEAGDGDGAIALEAAWKTAYLEVLERQVIRQGSYTWYPEASLIYLNDDNLPEFAVSGHAGGGFGGVWSYIGGKAVCVVGGGDGFDYIEREGIYYVQNGTSPLDSSIDYYHWNGNGSDAELGTAAVFDPAKSSWEGFQMSYEEAVAYLSNTGNTQTTQSDDAAWKAAYLSVLANVEVEYGREGLRGSFGYVDNDSIPELFLCNGTTLVGVYSYRENNHGSIACAGDKGIGGMGWCEYVERSGSILFWSDGHAGEAGALGCDECGLFELSGSGYRGLYTGTLEYFSDGTLLMQWDSVFSDEGFGAHYEATTDDFYNMISSEFNHDLAVSPTLDKGYDALIEELSR